MTETDTLPRRTLHITTWGCQMNAYDSGRMADVLRPLGYRQVETQDADMVILNTCHIRERASEKLFSELGRLRLLKEARGSAMMIAVAGCVAQAEGAEILARAPYVDLVVGSQAYHRLPELIAEVEAKRAAVIDTDFPAAPKFDYLPEAQASQGPIAFLAIQEGCDKFCTFCVVPYTRGAEASRPVAAIVAEAKRLVALGAREIALLGQNVNAWHGEAPDGKTWPLARLLAELAEIPDLARLRYTTSHPRDMDAGLIAAHRDNPKLMPFLHLPVQSGSDAVLARMNRRHDADLFRRIVADLRDARPDIALSSDFIVGFPGETDADFAATMRLVRETGFALAYSFKYSSRPGTPAADAPDQVDESLKDSRLQELQAVLREQQHAFNLAQVGKTFDVLFTGPGRHPGQIAGRSPYLQPVVVNDANIAFGTIRPMKIVQANPNSLMASLNQEPIAA
ncbi:MAG: tRNA (N6-isopentenyl adenosine(37)-C2)-methylthiotransferase MiaB [Acidiphilium sp.]